MRAGNLTCVDLVYGYLNRIVAYDQAGPKLNSTQNVNAKAREIAKLDRRQFLHRMALIQQLLLRSDCA